MCGIAGVVAWEDRYRTDAALLERMSQCLAHRGPDGQGTFINHQGQISRETPQAALAHRRLAVLDPDVRANQPLTDGHGRWIVFNGEIYNFRELRKELDPSRQGLSWRTQGDTEVLLAAYGAWGPACLDKLNGMFAFAIWDESAGKLFLARDRMGQKPLYLATAPPLDAARPPAAIAFASELSALRKLPWFDSSLDLHSLASYLAWGYVPPAASIYTGARKLCPATYLEASHSGTQMRRYFQLRPGGDPLSDDDAVAQTRRLVTGAVNRQLVADVPLGCLLSGGMDSSVIAAAMTAPGQRVLTFSIGFDEEAYDETRYAAAVGAHLGTEHRSFTVHSEAAADLPKLAKVFGEPFADSSALPTHYLAKAAREHVTVALGGDGGDELFGGYDRYRALVIGQRLLNLPGPLRRAAAGAISTTNPKGRLTRLRRLLATLDKEPPQRYASYLRLFDTDSIRALVLPELTGAAEDDDVADQFRAAMQLTGDIIPAALATDRALYLPEDLLTKIDRASMLHALEVRSPFMDHELVQFAARLTTPQLLAGGPKRMLREAFAADLPGWVFRRRKMGFAVPIGQWFRGELRPMLRDMLFAANSFASAHFQRPAVQRLVDEHEERKADHSQRLYALLMLELWHADG